MATNKKTNNQHVVLMWGGGNKDGCGGEPVVAQGLDGIHVKQIVCAREIPTPMNGFVRAYVLTEEGQVFQWGPSLEWNSVPHESRKITSGSLIGKTVTQIATGCYHFAAVTEDGELYTWGCGSHGKLGHGDKHDSDYPKLVEALTGIHIVKVVCASYNTVALSQDGNVYTFGHNGDGRNGNGRTERDQFVPTRVEELPPIDSLSASASHIAALCHQGRVYTWGRGERGRLGHGNEVDYSTPQKIESLSQERIVQVFCGVCHTAAQSANGQVHTFGDGGWGKLGHNIDRSQTAPKLVESLVGTVISQVSCGSSNTCFLSQAGHVLVCGSGKHGHGSGTDISVPQKIQCLEKYNITHLSSFGCCTVVLATLKPTTLDEIPIFVALRNMVNSEESSDVVFQTDEGQVFAHKIFLVHRSEFFRAMITSGMKESSSHVIQLSSITKNTLLLVLEYLYTGSVSVPLNAVVDLFIAADMYGFGPLKQLCLGSLSEHLSVDNAAQLLLETAESKAEELTSTCFQYVVKNIKDVSKTAAMEQVAKNDKLILKILRSTANRYE